MQQLILTLVFYALMAGIVALLGLMYASSRKKDLVIAEALLKSSDAANKAADAAQKLAVLLERKHAEP